MNVSNGAAVYDIVIADGLLVTPGGVVETDVAIDGEVIAAIGADLNGTRIIDAAGCYVIPGGVDPHVHLQMQIGNLTSADTFASGSIAAAYGGTTTFVDFADPEPGEGMVAALQRRRTEADEQVAVDYALHMTIPASHAGSAEHLADIPKPFVPAVPRLNCIRHTSVSHWTMWLSTE